MASYGDYGREPPYFSVDGRNILYKGDAQVQHIPGSQWPRNIVVGVGETVFAIGKIETRPAPVGTGLSVSIYDQRGLNLLHQTDFVPLRKYIVQPTLVALSEHYLMLDEGAKRLHLISAAQEKLWIIDNYDDAHAIVVSQRHKLFVADHHAICGAEMCLSESRFHVLTRHRDYTSYEWAWYDKTTVRMIGFTRLDYSKLGSSMLGGTQEPWFVARFMNLRQDPTTGRPCLVLTSPIQVSFAEIYDLKQPEDYSSGDWIKQLPRRKLYFPFIMSMLYAPSRFFAVYPLSNGGLMLVFENENDPGKKLYSCFVEPTESREQVARSRLYSLDISYSKMYDAPRVLGQLPADPERALVLTATRGVYWIEVPETPEDNGWAPHTHHVFDRSMRRTVYAMHMVREYTEEVPWVPNELLHKILGQL